MCAIHVWISKHARGEMLHRIHRPHAETRNNQQQISRREALRRGADFAVDICIVPIQQGAIPLPLALGGISNPERWADL